MDTPEMNLAAEQFQLSAADRLMNYLGQSRLAKGIGATGLFLAAGSGVMLA